MVSKSLTDKLNNSEKEEILIGLEIHVTLKTKKKVFNNNKSFLDNNECNDLSIIGSWELGYLGDLPVLNHEVIEKSIKLCSSLNCEISEKLLFDRKIYSYFDLPKGFQITQERKPVGINGMLPTFCSNNTIKEFPIERVQIEEDTAKSSYFEDEFLLDFRRSGNPLVEIVTKPVFYNIEDALSFARQLRSLLIYLEISDAKMELGQFRVDMNFSFSKNSYKSPRYEVKNLNSFKNIKKSFDQLLEKQRILSISDSGNDNFFSSETLGYNESTQKIFFQREKTSYSYVEEYNIIPVLIEKSDILEFSPKSILPWKIVEKFPLDQREFLSENEIFLSFVNSLESEGIEYSENLDDILTFVSRFLLPSLKRAKRKHLNSQDEIKKIWLVLNFCSQSKVDNDQIIDSIFKILTDNSYFPKKKDMLSKVREKATLDEMKREMWEAVKLEKNQKKLKKSLLSHQKLFSFTFGILKEIFPSKDIEHQDVLMVSNDIWENLETV